jgi:hypothetical protein
MARAQPWRGGSATHTVVEVEIETLPASPCQDVNRARARRERAPRQPPVGEHRASTIVHRGAATRARPRLNRSLCVPQRGLRSVRHDHPSRAMVSASSRAQPSTIATARR